MSACRVRRSVLVGAVLASLLSGVGTARAGFISVALTAGAAGSAGPSFSGGFQFTNPTGSPEIGISDLVAAGSAQANTAGGSAFFAGPGLPIVVSISDGVAVISSAGAPAGAVPSGGLSSVAPTAPDTIPTGAAVLGVSLSDAAGGTQTLSVSVTNGLGSELGRGTVAVPEGGWWVIGLSPEAEVLPPVVDPPVTPPVVVRPVTPPTAATPEPATLVLAGLGLPLIGAARLLRSKRPH